MGKEIVQKLHFVLLQSDNTYLTKFDEINPVWFFRFNNIKYVSLIHTLVLSASFRKKRPRNNSNTSLKFVQIEGIFFRINYGIHGRRYWDHYQLFGDMFKRLVCRAKDKNKKQKHMSRKRYRCKFVLYGQRHTNLSIPLGIWASIYCRIKFEKENLQGGESWWQLQLATIMVVIFWDFLMLDQIFLSPQMKPSVIIYNKLGIYELPNNLRLKIRKSGNITKNSKLHRVIA